MRILFNSRNLGFVATANRGMAETTGDVLLLNADTEVPFRLVERLRLATYSHPEVASATPFSNHAGAFSAPLVEHDNLVPVGSAEAGRLIARHSGWTRPDSPTANGFCMFIKRRALDQVGLFDRDRFPRGYGEENDWSMRAAAAGWRHVVDDATYVLHHRSASFGDERAVLAGAGMAELRATYPGYDRLVGKFLRSAEMEAARDRVGHALAAQSGSTLPRVLQVLHEFGGGVRETTSDLVIGLSGSYEGLILGPTTRGLELVGAGGDRLETVEFDTKLRLEDTTRSDYREAVADLLVRHDIEIVHIRQLMRHTLDLPAVARELGIPVVLSVHDYYLLCPTAHLIDESGRFCGGRCTPGQGVCPASPWVAEGPHLKHGWVEVWKARVEQMLEIVDVVVAASETAAEIHRRALPGFAAARWEIIEHGRDLDQSRTVGEFPAPGEPIRLVLAGTIGEYKGAKLVAALKDLDHENRLEFHVFGTLPGGAEGVIAHGVYRREDLADRLAEIRPAALAMLSITAETYSHTLTEAWSLGLPVIATDLGAPAERIRRHGGGWLIPVGDPKAAYRRIIQIFEDQDGYTEAVAQARAAHGPTVSEMAARYADLYDLLRRQRLTVGGGAAYG